MLRSFMAGVVFFSSTAAFAQDRPTTLVDESVHLERRISPGDTLVIDVSPAKEYSCEVLVQPNGTIEILMIGAIHVAGLSAEQARELLTEKLSKYVSHPKVNISTRYFSSRFVIIAGEVNQAGTFEYKDDMRIMDILLKAGGPKDNAKLRSVKIFRKEAGDKTVRLVVNFQKVLDGDMSGNIQLKPMDMVYVPVKPFTVSARWLNDNILPWVTIFLFGITIALLTRKNP